MATTVHIPPGLLRTVDERAQAHRVSRNRFIIRALEHVLQDETSWSAEFLEALGQVDRADQELVDEMLEGIEQERANKGPVDL